MFMPNEVSTGKMLKLIETDNINKVPFNAGQFIIVDDGMMYYDSTIGKSIDDRLSLTPKHEIDTYIRENNLSDEYYLSLHTQPILGDMVIIKDLIPNTTKYSFTIYLYNDNPEDTNTDDWVKLTESYNASNVYFDKDITIAVDIPGIDLVDGKKIINSTGKNIFEVFNSIFYPEKNPDIIKPSITVNFPEAGCYELGTVIIPTYEVSFNPGEYEFGPDTDVQVNEYEIKSSTGAIKTTSSGSFQPITIDDDTDFYITTTIYHSDGTIPINNKNNEYFDGQIKAAGLVDISKSITGYLNGLYYGVSEQIIDPNTVDSNFIKTLNKTQKAYNNEPVNMTVPIGSKSIILACPVENIGISEVFNHTANCDMFSAFGTPVVKNILDNNESNVHAKDYNVWIYTPAESYEFNTKLTIICG